MSRVKGALLAAAAVLGFFLATGTLDALSSTPAGVFGIVAVLATLSILIGWHTKRR